MLVGSKSDIVDENPSKRMVSKDLVESFCRQQNLQYIETSAKTGANIRESFDLLLQSIYDMGDKNPGNQELEMAGTKLTRSSVEDRPSEKDSSCCN